VSVIAPPALGITRRRDSPGRTTISPWAGPADRHRRSSAQRPDWHRAVPPRRRAGRDPRLLRLAQGPAESGRPAARLPADHRPVREVAAAHPERSCTRVQTNQRTAPGTWRCSHATGSAAALSVLFPRSGRVSGTARLTASGLSEEGR
jgi:hypothetical protein